MCAIPILKVSGMMVHFRVERSHYYNGPLSRIVYIYIIKVILMKLYLLFLEIIRNLK